MKTKRVMVRVPISGVMSVEIEVPEGANDDEMFDAAIERWSENETACDLEWEFHHIICEGNTFNGAQNEVEFTRMDTES